MPAGSLGLGVGVGGELVFDSTPACPKAGVRLLFELKQNRAFGFCLSFLYGNARGAGFKMTGIYGALGFWGVKLTITSIFAACRRLPNWALNQHKCRAFARTKFIWDSMSRVATRPQGGANRSLVCSSSLQWRSSSLPTQAVASDRI